MIVPTCAEHRCVKGSSERVFAVFKAWAIPYDVCGEHHAQAGAGEAMTFRGRDGLMLGYARGMVRTQTEKPLRHE